MAKFQGVKKMNVKEKEKPKFKESFFNSKQSAQLSKRESYRKLIFNFFVSCIIYRKIHKYLIKFIKTYKYTNLKDIFIINF